MLLDKRRSEGFGETLKPASDIPTALKIKQNLARACALWYLQREAPTRLLGNSRTTKSGGSYFDESLAARLSVRLVPQI
jgi:hypothetical protein